MKKSIANLNGRPPKKTYKKNSKTEMPINYDNLTLVDVMCPICLSIMIEPVSMPCSHSLCMPCFQSNVSEAALACPLCRKRISIWVRKNAKINKLINEPLWQWINDNFKEKVNIRLQGFDDPEDSLILATPLPKVCAPGEIREEYQAQLEQARKEEEVCRLKEESASEVTILSLQEEEDRELARIEREKEILHCKDLELARQLQDSDAKERLLSLKKYKSKLSNISLSPIISGAMNSGPMDIYLSQKTPKFSDKLHRNWIHSTPFDVKSDINTNEKRTCGNYSKSPDILAVATPSPGLKRDSIPKTSVEDFSNCSVFRTDKVSLNSPSKKECRRSISPEYPLFVPPVHLKKKSSESSKGSNSNVLNVVTSKQRHLKDITSSYSSESEVDMDSEEEDFFNEKAKVKKANKENFMRKRRTINNITESSDDYKLDARENKDEVLGFSHNMKNVSLNSQKSASSSIGNLRLSTDNENMSNMSTDSQATEASVVIDGVAVDENMMSKLIEEQKAIERLFEQEKQDRLFAIQLEKDMKKVNRSKGSEDQYSLRNYPSSSSTSSPSSKKKKIARPKRPHSDKLRQTTLVENISKRQKKV